VQYLTGPDELGRLVIKFARGNFLEEIRNDAVPAAAALLLLLRVRALGSREPMSMAKSSNFKHAASLSARNWRSASIGSCRTEGWAGHTSAVQPFTPVEDNPLSARVSSLSLSFSAGLIFGRIVLSSDFRRLTGPALSLWIIWRMSRRRERCVHPNVFEIDR